MLRYTLVRLAQGVLVLWVVVTVVFLLSRASGNIAELMAPPDAPPETVALIEENLGLDKPLIVQYGRYLGDLLQGDLGMSFAYRAPVTDLIREALPKTIQLGLAAFVFAITFGIPIGVLSAMRPGGWFDGVGKGVALAGQSVPNFWLGILLVLFFSVRLGWLPAFGYGSWKNLVLPAIALGWYPLASLARLTRSAVIEVLNKDHTLFQRAKGVPVHNALHAHDAQRLAADRHARRHPARLPVLGAPSSSRPCSPGRAWASWRSRGSTPATTRSSRASCSSTRCSSCSCCWSSTCPTACSTHV